VRKVRIHERDDHIEELTQGRDVEVGLVIVVGFRRGES
jgi:hypothetical protein